MLNRFCCIFILLLWGGVAAGQALGASETLGSMTPNPFSGNLSLPMVKEEFRVSFLGEENFPIDWGNMDTWGLDPRSLDSRGSSGASGNTLPDRRFYLLKGRFNFW